MKKFALVLSFVVMLAFAVPAGATYINFDKQVVGNEFKTTVPVSQTETFDNQSLLWGWSGNRVVLTGSVAQASAPFGAYEKDTSYYVSVPAELSITPQSATVTGLGGKFNYFGLWWGSVDTYNTISFYDGATLVASYTGQDILNPNPANGNQTAPSQNLYVNFYNLPWYDSFVMASSNYAFEADNIAIGIVPEPTTMLLLGFGLLGIAGVRRFK